MKYKTNFLTGLLIWLPLVVTILIVQYLVEILDNTLEFFPYAWQPEQLLGFNVPGLGVIFTLIVVYLSGVLTTNLFGRQIIAYWEGLLIRIPLVNSIYSSVKQVAETFLASGKASFSQVVLIEFPSKGIWAIGLVTGTAPHVANQATRQELVSVIVATTPNPTSGFIVMVPKDNLMELQMSVEEALKYVISMGMIVPEQGKDISLAVNSH